MRLLHRIKRIKDIDADYKTPIEELAKVLPFLSEYDIAIGSQKIGCN